MKSKGNAHRKCAVGESSIAFGYLQSKRHRVFAAALAAGVGLTLGAQSRAASSDTWVGNDGATANWSDGADWFSGSAPASGDSLNFGAAGSSGTALNDNLGAGFSIGNITFLNGAAAYTFSTNNSSSIDLGTGGAGSIINNSTSLETISNINLILTGNLTDDTAYGNEIINSVISGGTFGLTKSGSGTLSLTGADTFTGQTSIGAASSGTGTTAMTGYGGGTLDLNFAGAGAPTTNILYNGVTAGQVNFGGGTLEIDGAASKANSQTLGTLNLDAGFSTIDLKPGAGGTVTLSTGSWTSPAVGSLTNNNGTAGQMNLIIPTGSTLLTSQANASGNTAVSGVLSFGGVLANVTVNSTSWAERSGGLVIALPTSSYYASTAGTILTATAVGSGTQATDVVINGTLDLVAAKTNSLRFNTAANETLTLFIASLTLNGGGILMTPNVGANTETIAGGALGDLAGAPSAGLTIFQYDTLGTLAINTVIENNASGTGGGLTIGGGGVVSLGAANTFTGNTNINGGTLITTQNTNFGAAATGAGATSAAINIDGGTLEAAATYALDTTATTGFRNIGIGSMGATFDVTSTFALTVPGAITSQNIAGAGNLTKTDTGTLILSGTDSYVGNTTVTAGILELNSAGALPGGVGAAGGTSALVINGGIVALGTGATTFSRGVGTGSSQVQWTGSGGFASFSGSSTINFGGASAPVKWNTNGFVPNGSTLVLGATAATGSVTITNPIDFNGAVQTIQATGTTAIAGILSGALSDGGFNKTGTGVLELTGTSTYTGATNINAGTLLIGSTASLGNTAVAVNASTFLTAKGATGAIGGIVTLNSGGAINLENAAIGDTLTLGGLNLAGGGAIDLDLSPTNHSNDALAISGGGTITNAGLTSLNFADTSTLSLVAGNTYTLMTGVPSTAASDFVYNPNQFSSLSLSVAVSGTSLVLTVSSPAAAAAVAYWKGGVDSVWSDASNSTTNWVNSGGTGIGLPGSGTQVVFSYSGGATNQASTTIGSVTAVDSLMITDPTNLNIGGTGTLTLGPATVSNGITLTSTAGTDTISTTGLALGKSQTWSNASSNLLTVSSVVSGTATSTLTINSTGTGAILLTGTNTYAGPTILTAGTLQIGNTAALGTGSTTINGGTLDLDGHSLTLHGIIGSGGTITDSVATSTVTLTDSLASGTTTYAGSITNGSGIVALTVSGNGTQDLTGSSNSFTGGTTITGTLQIGDGATNIGSLPGNVVDNKTLILDTPGAQTLSYAGNISGTGSVVVSGAGTDNLSGNNTNTAGMTVNLGTLQMGSSTGLDNVPVILANTTLDLNSFSVSVKSLTTASTAVNAVVTNSSTAAVSNLTVTAGGNYYGTIIDGAAVGGTALTLTGGSLALFNSANSYTGATTINGGTLSFKGGGSLGITAVAVNNTGAIAASGALSKIGGIVTVNTGGAINLENGVAGDLLTLGGLSLTGGGALDFDLSSTNGISDALAFSGGGTFTNVGTTALNFANVGALVAGDTYTLISGAVGISASDFTYNSNFSSSLSLSVFTSGNSLMVSVGGPPAPTTIAYWKGNLNTVWSDTSGSTTNWVDVNGAGVTLPTSITQVIFSTAGATNQASTTIGAITAVDSVEINDPTNLTIGGSTSTLTLEGVATGNGITIDSTAGTDVISTKGLVLGGPQTWSNNSPNLLTISSVVSGVAANTLTINSAGTGAILLNAADTYTGGTTIANGTVQIGNATALGTGKTTINGGELDVNGHAATLHGIFGAGGTITDSAVTASTITDSIATGTTATFAGSITNGSGTVALSVTGAGVQILTGSGNTFTGGTTIASTSTLVIGDGVSNTGSLSGNVSDGHDLIFNTPASDTLSYAGNVSVAGAILVNGPGTTNLAGDNTISGTVSLGVTVNAGTLQMGSNTGLDNVPLTMAANTTLDLNSYSPTVSTLTTASTATSAVITNTSTAAVSTLTVTAGGNYYGKITDGASVGGTALTLTGGTLALFNSANSYTGATTINGGTLALNAGGSLAATAVAINNNGTLTASGAAEAITGSVSVNNGGALDLRNGVAGDTLTIGSLNLAGGSLGFDVNATSNVSDVLNVTSFSNVGTTALNFAEIGTLAADADLSYTLISGGTGISTADFSFNSTITQGINNYIASLSAPGGTSLVLTIAAEPPPPLFAYWTGAVSSVWSDGAGSDLTNWIDPTQDPAQVNVIPGGITQVIFSSTTGTVMNEASTTLGAVNAIDSLTLNTATSLTIGGTGVLTIVGDYNNGNNGSGIVVGPDGGTDVINVPGISLYGPQTWSNNSNNLLTVSSTISGGSANSLTINNSGTADILLTGDNTYTGGTIIADGTLQIGSSTALGAGPLAVNGGTLDLNGQSILLQGISGSGGLITDTTATFAGISSSLATGTTMTYSGNITNGAGVVNLALMGGGTQILLGSGNTYSGGTTIGYPATLQIGDGVSNVGSYSGDTNDNSTLIFDTPTSSTITYTNNVSGLGIVTADGTGTVVLSGDNTQDFGLLIDSGEVQMGSSTGIDAIPVTMEANSTLDLNTFSVTASSIAAPTTATTAVITNSGPLNTTSTLTVTGGNTYNGEINTGAFGGQVALAVPSGTLILTNLSSTYTAGTTITTGGTVEAGNGTTPTSGFAPYTDNILGTGFVTVSNGTLELNSQATASAAIGLQFNFSNSITLSGAATIADVAGINVLNGPLTINGTGNTITVSQAQMPLEIAGALSGTGSVTISGATNTINNPTKNVEFFGDGTGFTGNITLNASAAQIFIGSNTALNNANISINGNNTTPNGTVAADIYFPDNVGSALVFTPTPGQNTPIVGSINSANTGNGNIILATSDGQSPVFLSIGNNNGNSKLSGVISDIPTFTGATTLGSGLIKIGTGSLTLSAANTFTGGVTIANGTLVAADAVSSLTASSTGTGNVTLTGGILASTPGATDYVLGAVLGGNLTANTIAPGGVGTVGSLTIGGLTTTPFTTLNFDLGTGSGEVTNGDLLTLGTGTVGIGLGTLMSFGGSPAGGDDYRLIGDTSSGTVVDAITLSNFTLPTAPAGLTYALSNSVDAGFIDLVVGGSGGGGGPASLTWNNAGGATPSDGRTWDVNNNNNWNNGSSPNTVYTEGSNVTFNDVNNNGSNANAYNVTLNTTVQPASVFVNAAGNYTISGTGTIAGTGTLTNAGAGTLILSTPNSYTGGTVVTAGKLVIGQAGSNAVFTGPALTTGNTLTALPTGALSISGNGVVQLADGVTNQTFVTPGTGSLVVTSNINITSLSLIGEGTLDIGNNRIIIDYTTGHDPIASIEQWIANGFTDGETLGALPAIISSDIATDDSLSGLSYGIGYADGADGAIAGLPSGEIEIMYTLVGDANLDGTVNSEDFTPFSNNLNGSGRTWDQGDFNYDGTVNSEDFTPFSHDLNQSSTLAASETGTLLSPLQGAVQGTTNGISLTNVPEPASTGLLAIGAMSVLARRRRRARPQ